MSPSRSLPDLLQGTAETRGERVRYRFANGLVIEAEVFHERDRLRILPLGSPQGSLMNHLLGFPERVAGKRVFEPFAGSGALGLMALAAGAAHVDFLDVNPRAAEFQRENAALSGLPPGRFTSHVGDIASFTPARRYDLLLANPPFVPTPEGIAGTLTSNGGAEGSRFVEILALRLEALLEPSGRALVYVFQLVRDGRPLIFERFAALPRAVEITPAQATPIPFETYVAAYRRLFPADEAAVVRWREALVRKHGPDLSLSHFVVDVGPRSERPAACLLRDDFAEKFGAAFLVPSEKPEELAFGRVFENFVPDG
jgi:release factor glutamine methyltransferase